MAPDAGADSGPCREFLPQIPVARETIALILASLSRKRDRFRGATFHRSFFRVVAPTVLFPLPMKSTLLSKLAMSLMGSVMFLATASAQFPEPGNLTITVQENENGSVTFSASGTANAFFSGVVFYTPFDPNPANPQPPHALTGPLASNPPLPPGLFLTFPQATGSEPETAGSAEEGIPETVQFPLTGVIYPEGGVWALTDRSIQDRENSSPVSEVPKLYFVQPGAPITGSGSVTVNNIPFSNFVPGTFTIQPVTRRERESILFQITYKVIPLKDPGAPRLTLQNASAFPRVALGRSSRVQTLRLRNVGNVLVSGIREELDRNASDFQVRIPGGRSLEPGKTLTVQVRFRPTAIGRRRSTLSIRSNAPVVSTGLVGVGIRPPSAPRFPRGPF